MPTPITPVPNAPAGETFNGFDLKSFLDYDDKPAGPEPAPAVPPPPAPPKHRATTLSKGRAVGLTDEGMAAMVPEDLEDEIYFRLEREKVKAQAQAQAAAPAPAAKPAAREADFGGADLADLDDGLLAALKHLEARVHAAEVQIRTSAEHQVNRERASVYDRLDALFAANEPAFGKGPTGRINPATREAGRRNAVIAHLNMLQAQGRATTLEKDFADACEVLNLAAGRPAAPDPAAQAAAAEEERWKAAGLSRPSGQRAPETPKGPERAAEAVGKAMERAGISVNGNVDLSHFPD